MKLNYLSHSAAEQLARCGEQFRLRRVVRLAECPSWAQVGGSAAHSTTEAIDLKVDFGIDNGEPTDFNEALDKEIAEMEERSGHPKSEWKEAGRAPNKLGEKWWREEGPRMVQGWRDWLNHSGFTIWITPDGEPAVELGVRGEVGGGDALAFVDRVLGAGQGLMVVDLKFGTKEPQAMNQMGLYALLLADRFPGVQFPWATFYMARKYRSTPPESTDRWLRPEGGTSSLDGDFARLRKIAEQDLFVPSVGSHCDYMCGVKEYCRLLGENHTYDNVWSREDSE